MKVSIITTAFPSHLGDQRGTFILEAARAIQRAGADVSVLAMHSPGAKTRETWDGIKIYRPRYLPDKWEILQREGGGLPIIWKKNPWSRLAIVPFLVVHTIQATRMALKSDVVHANWSLSATAAWLGAWRHRRPIVATVQGSDMFQATKIPLVRRITQVTLKKIHRVLALSRSLADEVLALGVSPEKVEIIPNGVDIAKFRVGDEIRQPIILYVASLIERKGLIYLLQAFKEVLKTTPDAQLIVIGDGPMRNKLETTTSSLEISFAVKFLGWQTQEQVSEWMQKARVFVLPSVEEGLGVVLLEALACGTPCVGSAVGGIPDVITPDVGRLVPPRDPLSLGEALKFFMENPSWGQFSRNARKRAEDVYNWDQIASKILTIYQQVTSR
ncbi:MAG TPA: hypothetical protein DCP32_06800 [Anaerolineaceae bacterium]|nr:hypothetical protein [Anaerolineaceae bacterium]